MATYKVIQDVEAEDKIIGPLSLKQLIYAAIGFAIIFVAFKVVQSTGVIYVAIPFVPFVIVFFALAAPLSRDQTTEMWLAAMIRFYTKPRKRVWDQDGLKDLVEITAPKKIEKQYTDGLNQNQVRSRLQALANTMDSRGWAVKNVNTNMSYAYAQGGSDRLIDPSSLPQLDGNTDSQKATDILDVSSSTIAQNFDNMMKQSQQKHRQEIMSKMQQNAQAQPDAPQQTTPPPPADDIQTDNIATTDEEDPELKPDYWFTKETYEDLSPSDHKKSHHKTKPKKHSKEKHQSKTTTEESEVASQDQLMFKDNLVHPGEEQHTNKPANPEDLSPEEQATLEKVKKQQKIGEPPKHNHHKTVLTPAQLDQQAKDLASRQQAEFEKQQKQKEAKTHLSKTDTIEFAQAKDLKVSTVAGLAKHKTEQKKDPGEVVINLH